MNLTKLWAKIKLKFANPAEEDEYNKSKLPLLKDFLNAFLLCMIAALIFLSIHFFLLEDMLVNALLSIGMLTIAVFLLLARRLLGKWMEYIVITYLTLGVVLVVLNLNPILASLKPCESFYGGFAFGLLHRLLGYRIINVNFMIIVHLLSFSFRLVFLYDHHYSITLMAGIMEILTLSLSIKSEKGDRALFDSLYKSKQELLKFKEFFMDNFPSQMVILAKDYSGARLVNTPFRKSFKCEDIFQLKCSLKSLIIDSRFINNNGDFLSSLGYISEKSPEPLTLSQLVWLVSKNLEVIQNNQVLTFEVYEDKRGDQGFNEKGPHASIQVLEDTPQHKKLLEQEKTNKKSKKCQSDRTKGYKTQSYIVQEAEKTFTECLIRPKYLLKDSNNSLEKELTNKFKTLEETTKRYLKVKVFLLRWDGDEAIAITLDDVTSQKLITETELANMNKDLVTQMVSADLISPVANMVSLIKFAKHKSKDSAILPYIDVCKNYGELLLNFINSLLDFSLIKTNKFKPTYSKVQLQDLIDEIKRLFQPVCQIKSLYFKVEIGQNVPKILVTDRKGLRQIIVSLLSHSFKFTFEGGVYLKVDVDNEEPSKIRFTVQDTSGRMKQEDQRNLFKIFRQFENVEVKAAQESLHIELIVSNILVEILNRCNGQGIKMKTDNEKGNIYSFAIPDQIREIPEEKSSQETCSEDIASSLGLEDEGLPINNKEALFIKRKSNNLFTVRIYDSLIQKSKDNYPEPKKVIDSNSEYRSSKGFTRITVTADDIPELWCLIVDNNPSNLIIAQFLMQEKGYKVKTALDGKEGVDRVIEHEKQGLVFKVILMNCEMANMDGYEAVRDLRRMMEEKKINKCSIIPCIDPSELESSEKLRMAVGMANFLTKPLQALDLEYVLLQNI